MGPRFTVAKWLLENGDDEVVTGDTYSTPANMSTEETLLTFRGIVSYRPAQGNGCSSPTQLT